MKPRSVNHPARGRTRRSARGAALIEALIGILIFAFGVIGIIGLQAAMTRAQGTAKVRADANNIASEMFGMMWADQANIEKYADANCAGYVPCAEWAAKVETLLPGGAVTVDYAPATGIVDLTLTWSTPAEGTHTHVLTSSIR